MLSFFKEGTLAFRTGDVSLVFSMFCSFVTGNGFDVGKGDKRASSLSGETTLRVAWFGKVNLGGVFLLGAV